MSRTRGERICEAVHSYKDQVADEGKKLEEKEKNCRRAMRGMANMLLQKGIRGGKFRLEMKLLEEKYGGKILDPRKIRFRGSHGIGFKKIALL